MNGDGTKIVVIGIILAIVSTLFYGLEFTLEFWTDDIVYYFENIGFIFENLGSFFEIHVYFGLLILSILIFLIGLVFSLIGLKNFLSFIGGLLILYTPIVAFLIVLEYGNIGDLLSADNLSFFLMVAGGILCMVGGIKNKD
jgi:hypothetical protein